MSDTKPMAFIWLSVTLFCAFEIVVGLTYSMTVLHQLDADDFNRLTYVLIAVVLFHGACIARFAGIVSFPLFYFAVMTLYTASAPILYLTNGVIGLAYFRALDLDFLARTIPLIIVAMASFTFGVFYHARQMLPTKGKAIKSLTSQQIVLKSRTNNLLEVAALSLLLLSISVVLIETARGQGLTQIISGSYYEYSEARRTGSQSLLFNISMTRLLPISMITYNALLKHRLRRVNFSDFLLFIALAIPLAAGDRGTVLATFSVWLLIHQRYCKPISMWKLLLILVAVLIFIPVMQIMRSVGASNWSFQAFMEVIQNLSSADEKFQGQTLIAVLGPFSSSMMTFMGTLMMLDAGESLHFGYDYIMNLFAALPGTSSFAPNNSFQMHMYLIPNRQGGPGYMAIAEMYRNFHVFGIIVGHFALGYFLLRAQVKLYRDKLSAQNIAFLGSLFFTLQVWVRNEFTSVSQTMFYWWLFFWFLPYILRPIAPWKNKIRK